LTAEGLSLDAEKIEAISRLPIPTTKSKVGSMLGMLTFVKDFFPDMSHALAPLYNLLKDDTPFNFSQDCIEAVKQIMKYLTTQPVLKHFDPGAPTKVVTDASKEGLGAVLMQKSGDGKWFPVKYASRTTTPTEYRWAPIIKLELLAECYAMERYYVYTWGRRILVESDHRPLIGIMAKSINECSPRLQRMRLRLLRFDFDVSYVLGKTNWIADSLSRSGVTDKFSQNMVIEEGQMTALAVVLSKPFASARLAELEECTNSDPGLGVIKGYVEGGWGYYPGGISRVVGV
jgi:hypothetical protein